MEQGERPHIVYLPKWYPSDFDPQLGVFIRKHAQAAALQYRVSVVYAQADPGMMLPLRLEHQSSEGVDEWIAYYPHRSGSWMDSFHNARSWLRAISAAYKACVGSKGPPDLVHAHVLLRPMLMAWLLSVRRGLPIVLTEHWTGYVFGFFKSKSLIYRKLASFLLTRARVLTVVSPSLQQAMEGSGLYHPRYQILANVVDVGEEQGDGIPDDGRIRILVVADLVERNKNVGGVIRAFTGLARERGDADLHIVGGGPDEALLKSLAAGSGLPEGRIVFHGRLDNARVISHIRRCSFVVVNSRVETFSVLAAEALACGKPVVATRSGGPEFFVTERLGMLIDPDDDAVLINAMRRMLDRFAEYDPEELKAAMNARFSKASVGEALAAIYRELLS